MRRLETVLVGVSIAIGMLLLGSWFVSMKESSEGDYILPAKNELIIYSDLPMEMMETLAKTYSKKRNVRITVLPSTEKQLMTRFQLHEGEQRGDIVISDEDVLTMGAEEGALVPTLQGIAGEVDSPFTDSQRWIGIWLNPIIMVQGNHFFEGNGKYVTTWHALSSRGPWSVVAPDFGAIPDMKYMLYKIGAAWGEEEIIYVFQNLNNHVKQYMKHSALPIRTAAVGEAAVGIGYYSDAMQYKGHNYPLQLVYPRDGAPYRLYGAGILEGSKNEEESKFFIKWLLSKEAQDVLDAHSFYFMSTQRDRRIHDATGSPIQFLFPVKELSEEEQKSVLDAWIKKVRFRKGQDE